MLPHKWHSPIEISSQLIYQATGLSNNNVSVTMACALDDTFMKGILPSTENLAIEIWNQLCGPVAELGGLMHCVRVVETENNAVEYFGA